MNSKLASHIRDLRNDFVEITGTTPIYLRHTPTCNWFNGYSVIMGMQVSRVGDEFSGCYTEYRKPDQIIQPWMFGDPETKATCL